VVIYAKIAIEREDRKIKKTYIALLNSGAGLSVYDPEIDFLPILYILVPWGVGEELGIKREGLLRRGGKYWVDTESQYVVYLYDPYDNLVKCMRNVLLVIEDGLDELLIPYEFLAIAKIDLKPSKHAWVCEGKEIPSFFRVRNPRDVEKGLLKYTRYREYV